MKKEPVSLAVDKLYYNDAVSLLKELIRTPSFSREEQATAGLITAYLESKKVQVKRHFNNVWAVNQFYDEEKSTLLLNSHHDTVQPNKSYTLDPFDPAEKDGKLYGLGSNDAGGALVSLIQAFVFFYSRQDLSYNLLLAATAEEEITGSNGVESLLSILPKIDCAIVGEPTLMQLAVAERGLMVLDAKAHGVAGHAARREGVNAISLAIEDIKWLNTYQFEKQSEWLGPVSMQVTSIETQNKTHNIVPPECSFVVDVRLNELYSHEEVLDEIRKHVKSELHPRSFRLRSSSIALDHPLVKAALQTGGSCYGSPTSSDKALMSFPALKIGPGDSARSHTADEFIFTREIEDGINRYIKIIESLAAGV
ncbi:MAG: M20 family metallo-hydrolase [Flavisolibacter sp.]